MMVSWKTLPALLVSLAVVAQTQAADKVDFAKQIKPILEKSCLKCHVGDEPKGGLLMDTKKHLLKGGDTGKGVVPGKPKESLVYERVALPNDDFLKMPAEGDPLSEDQVALIRDWIKQGAEWPEDVSLKPVEPPKKKKSKDEDGLPITDAEKQALQKIRKTGALALRLAQNTNWLRVDFSLADKEITDDDLALLKDVRNLYELDLGETKVTDEGLKHLESAENLRRLHLEKTGISDAGLPHLKGLNKLTYLNLYGTNVSDKGVEHLKNLKNLRKVFLWKTKVTAKGDKALQQALSEVTINRGVELAAKSEEAEKKDNGEKDKKSEGDKAKKDSDKKSKEKKPEDKKEKDKKSEKKPETKKSKEKKQDN